MAVKLIVEDPDNKIIHYIHQINDSLTKSEDKMYGKIGITTQQYGVLAAIQSLEPPITITAVAEWLDRNPNSVTLLIDRMEKNGLVARLRDLNDRRCLRLSITDKGIKAFKDGAEPQKKLSKKMTSCLNQQELKELANLLDKVLDKSFDIRELKGKIKEVHVK